MGKLPFLQIAARSFPVLVTNMVVHSWYWWSTGSVWNTWFMKDHLSIFIKLSFPLYQRRNQDYYIEPYNSYILSSQHFNCITCLLQCIETERVSSIIKDYPCSEIGRSSCRMNIFSSPNTTIYLILEAWSECCPSRYC